MSAQPESDGTTVGTSFAANDREVPHPRPIVGDFTESRVLVTGAANVRSSAKVRTRTVRPVTPTADRLCCASATDKLPMASASASA